MSRIWDLSLPISPDMLTWPGDPPVRIEPAHRIARGDAANVSELHMGTHTGTHVDPPHHFLDGSSTIESLPLDVLMGDAEQEGCNPAGAAVLRRVLRERPGPRRGVARALDAHPLHGRGQGALRDVPADHQLQAAGAREQVMAVVHDERLPGGVIVIEGLNLSGVEPGRYKLICLPIKILGGDGAPARAVLVEV